MSAHRSLRSVYLKRTESSGFRSRPSRIRGPGRQMTAVNLVELLGDTCMLAWDLGSIGLSEFASCQALTLLEDFLRFLYIA